MKTYLRHRIVNVVDIKELIALEYLDFEGKYKNYEEKHSFWELCFVEEGSIELILEKNTHVLNSGDLFFIPPDKSHSYRSGNGNESKVFVVCYESFSLSMKSLSEARFTLNYEQKSCLKLIIDESENTFRMNSDDHLEVLKMPNFGGQQAILLQLEYLLIKLMRQLSVKKDSEIVFLSEEQFYADLVGIIIRFFNENIGKKLTLEEICAKVNYSRSFLCKTFKEQTGETLFSCFNRMKIDEAKRLLTETSLSVTDISAKLGFSELKYFCSLFKKQTGFSPAAFRDRKEH